MSLLMLFVQLVIDLCVWACLMAVAGHFITSSILMFVVMAIALIVQTIVRYEGYDLTYLPTAIKAYEAAKPRVADALRNARTSGEAYWARVREFVKSKPPVVVSTVEGDITLRDVE